MFNQSSVNWGCLQVLSFGKNSTSSPPDPPGLYCHLTLMTVTSTLLSWPHSSFCSTGDPFCSHHMARTKTRMVV